MLSSGSLVVDDADIGGEHDVTKLSGGEEVSDDLLVLCHFHVEPGRDDSAFINSTQELNYDLAPSSIVNYFEIADVALFLHQLQEFDDDLGAGSD